jgi:hypothetical protein
LDHEIAKEREGTEREDREDGAHHAKPRLTPFSIIILSTLYGRSLLRVILRFGEESPLYTPRSFAKPQDDSYKN